MSSPSSASLRRYLFVLPGTPGFIYPGIRLAHALQRKGHEVLLVGSVQHETLMRFHGLDFIGLTHAQKEPPFLHISNWYEVSANSQQFRLLQKVGNFFHPDHVICSPLNISALTWSQTNRIPTVTLGLAFQLFPHNGSTSPTREWRLKEFTKFHNQVRRALDLEALDADQNIYPKLMGDITLCRTLPDDSLEATSQTRYIGSGLYWDPNVANVRLEHFLSRNLDHQRPLIYVQLGRLFDRETGWAELMSMFSRLPFDFVADMGRADYRWHAKQTPDNVLAQPFVPVGAVADQASCLLTTAQTTGFLAGIEHCLPHLAIPFSAEGEELGDSIESLGIGRVVKNEGEFDLKSVNTLLQELIHDTAIANTLPVVRKRFRDLGGEKKVLEAVLESGLSGEQRHP